MGLTDDLREMAFRNGAALYGIADLSPAREYIREQGGEIMAGYPRAVSVGIRLLDTLVDLLPVRDKEPLSVLYRYHSYEVVNHKLDLISLDLAGLIQEGGFRAFPVPSSKRTDNARICGPFSHKLAAHLAGLGWIGKSCLLVTPEHGPRVRWTTVLTDAPLVPVGRPMEPRCGECRECANHCPAGAIKGVMFVPSGPRKDRLDAGACDHYFTEMEKRGEPALCGMCLYICPHGRNERPRLHE